MNYTEFIEIKARYERKRKKVLWVALIAVLSVITVFMLIATLRPEFLDSGFISVFGVLAIMGVAFIILYFERYAAKSSGLICPICKSPFSGDEIKTVTATRNCTHCGKEVFSESNQE